MQDFKDKEKYKKNGLTILGYVVAIFILIIAIFCIPYLIYGLHEFIKTKLTFIPIPQNFQSDNYITYMLTILNCIIVARFSYGNFKLSAKQNAVLADKQRIEKILIASRIKNLVYINSKCIVKYIENAGNLDDIKVIESWQEDIISLRIYEIISLEQCQLLEKFMNDVEELNKQRRYTEDTAMQRLCRKFCSEYFLQTDLTLKYDAKINEILEKLKKVIEEKKDD